MKKNQKTEPVVNPSRRSFLKTSLALATTAAFADVLVKAFPVSAATYDGENAPDIEDATFKYVFSVCQNCHSRCGIVGKVKVTATGHELVKLEGNPYHPKNLEEDERANYADEVFTNINGVNYLTKPGRLCPKGQSGVQVVYDPYRVKHPLKRVGKRGSGQWKTISWATAFSEISARVKSLVSPWDQRMTTPVVAGDAALKVGPIANQVMFSPRTEHGCAHHSKAFHGIGTTNNRLDHTSICETSHHVANKMMTSQDGTGANGNNDHFKAEIEWAKFLLWFGANPLEANFPILALSRKVVDFKKNGGKMAVIDPRFSRTSSKADYWVPVKPGTDGALALGRCRYLIDNSKVNITFLSNCNAADAAVDSETCHYSLDMVA